MVGDARRSVVAILLIYVLPFALVWFGAVPVELRRWLYVGVGVGAAAVAFRTYSLRELGVGWFHFRSGAVPYAVFALLGGVGIVAIALLAGRTPRDAWWLAPHFRYGILIPVSAAQEFFYRSMLMPFLRSRVRAPWLVVLLNATLFTFLHIIFPDPAFVLPISFLGGVAFAWFWLRWPNLLLASAAHVILNAAFTLFCFGSFEASCLPSAG